MMDLEVTSPAHEQMSGIPHEATIQQQAAVSDLRNDHEVPPEDLAVSDALRGADDKLGKGGDMNMPQVAQPIEAGECFPYANESDTKSPTLDVEPLQNVRDNHDDIRPVQHHGLSYNLDSMAAIGAGGVPVQMVKTAADMMSNIEPEEFRKMLEVASSSLSEKGPGFHTFGEESSLGLKIPDISDEMVKMALGGVSQMTPEELQKMLSMVNLDDLSSSPTATINRSCQNSKIISGLSVAAGETNSGGFLPDSEIDQLSCSIPTSAVNLQVSESDLENANHKSEAYNEFGNLEDAFSNSGKAHEVSRGDAADVLRDADSFLKREGGDLNMHQLNQSLATDCSTSSPSAEYPVEQPVEAGQCSRSASESYLKAPISDAECVESLGDDVEAIRLSQNDVFPGDLDSLAALSSGGISAEIIKTATDMMSNMEPEELQKMLEVALSLNVKGPIFNSIGRGSRLGLDFPEMTLEMVKMTSDKVNQMTPEELQKMLETVPLVNMNVIFSPRPAPPSSTQRSKSCSDLPARGERSALGKLNTERNNASGLLLKSKTMESSSSFPSLTADFPESMQHLANDPATQQMVTYMMKDMSPEMMTSMSEQLGMNLPSAEIVNAQQALASISEDGLAQQALASISEDGLELDTMEERVKGPETMEKTTIWFIGKAGLNLAICMMILAFIFHKLGYIRG